MVKRIAATILWFISLSAASEYATLIAGVPPVLGLALAGAVSAFVGLDPLHVLWSGRENSAEDGRSVLAPVPHPVRSQA